MNADSVTDYIYGHVPELVLLIGGLMALLIVYTYLKDKDSRSYKACMYLGAILGALMIILSVSSYASWAIFTAIVIAITGFTLIIRPFREVQFAVILAIFVMVLAYIFLGGLTGTAIDIVAAGWPRIICTFLIGALVYMVANFAEKVIMAFGKLFNWWPLLLVLSLVCIVEAVLMLGGYGSIYDLFN